MRATAEYVRVASYYKKQAKIALFVAYILDKLSFHTPSARNKRFLLNIHVFHESRIMVGRNREKRGTPGKLGKSRKKKRKITPIESHPQNAT